MLRRVKKQRFSILVLVLFLQNVAHGTSVSVKDLNSTLSKDDISKLITVIDKVVVFHSAHVSIPKVFEIPVRLFESEREYKKYQEKISKTSRSRNGFYSSSKKEVVVNKNEYYFKTIIHEAQHFILRSGLKSPPKWINEGLSEFYETSYIYSDKVYVKEQSQKRKRLQQWLREKALLALSQFLVLSNNDWKKQNEKPEFRCSTISWGLVYFLMSTPDGKNILSLVIKELREDSGRSLVLLEEYYEGGVKTLERDFYEFINKMPSMQEISTPNRPLSK